MNIDHNTSIDNLTLIKFLKEIESPFLPEITVVYNQIKDLLNSGIPRIFPNYTLHDTGHSFRIMEYMSKLVHDYRKLNELEVVVLVYSALLHDIGMAVSEDDVCNIKSDNFEYCDVKFSSMKRVMQDDESMALQEYVRRIHASLSKRYIVDNLKSHLVIPNLTSLDFTNELAAICQSHTEDYDWIKSNLRPNEVRGDYFFNSQFIAAILRLADILDIDGNRTPHQLYKLISPEGVSGDEWKQHFVIFNNDKVVCNEKTNQRRIVFHGKATNPSIHRKILGYISWVGDELTNAVSLVNGMPSHYSLMYDTSPEINIQTEGYSFSDYKMTLEFKAISSLLMGEKIYGDKSLGLRELIQNSIDACKLRQETEISNQQFGEDSFMPKIKVILDKDKNQVIIKDNGIGMSLDVIKKHFLNIGVSYYNSVDFRLKDFTYKPIGNFGIGFLSCFMLSNEVKVITRNYKSKDKYVIELEKGNEFTSLTKSEDVQFEGTAVILNYSNFLGIFNNERSNIESFLSTFFITDGVQVELVCMDEKKRTEISNSIAIPMLDKGFLAVDFKDYLNEIEGYALIKKKRSFIKQFGDLDFVGDLYIYDDENGIVLVENKNDLKIDDYLNDNKIKYLLIPIVESHIESDFQHGLKFTDGDVSEVLKKLDNDLKWISILVKKEHQEYLSEETIEEDERILEKFHFRDLVLLGHSENCSTECSVQTITIFEGVKNNLYLPFDTKTNDYYNYVFSRNKVRKELFIRNVFIRDFNFNIPISASVFEVEKVVVNINSRKFIPDISRNNVDTNQRNIINQLISKAIHQGAIEVLKLEKEEKRTINSFLTRYYSEKSNFEKN